MVKKRRKDDFSRPAFREGTRKADAQRGAAECPGSAFSRRAWERGIPLHALAGTALIIGAVFFVYAPSLNGGFILDDDLLLTESSLIKASDGLYRFWCTTQPADYWPVSNTTLWIEWRLWGMHPDRLSRYERRFARHCIVADLACLAETVHSRRVLAALLSPCIQ